MSTTHISIRHDYFRQQIEEGLVKSVFIKSKMNTVDVFKNKMKEELFIRHINIKMNGESEKVSDDLDMMLQEK